MKIFYSLYDRLLDRRALAKAFEKVRRASGAPGADGQRLSVVLVRRIESFGERTEDQDLPAATCPSGDDPEARWR